MRTLRLCFVIAFVVFLRSNLLSQCSDTLLKPNTKIRDTMELVPPIVCPSPCYGNAGAAVEISDSCGVVLVTGDAQVVRLVLTIGCDSVLLDTCVLLGQPPAFVALAYDWGDSNTYILTAFGPAGYVVTFSSGPPQSGLPAPPPMLYDADTCGGPLVSAPCPIDTLHAFAGPPSVVDVVTDCDSLECYNASCGGAHTSTIVVDSLFSGCIYVIGDSSTVSLIVRTTLDSIVLDTCISVIDDTTFGYRFCADVGGYYMTICAFDTLNYSFLGVYSGASLPFPSGVVATVGCPTTEIDSPQIKFHECRWQNAFGEIREIPLPLGLWFCRECKRKIVVKME